MKNKRTDILKTLKRHPEIILLLFIGIITTIAYPLRSFYVVLPFFSEKLLNYSEEEAEKTANYWASKFVTISSENTIELRHGVDNMVKNLAVEFGLEKVKIFDKKGKILYSTDAEDINEINTHDYFHLIVANGNNFSKIVTKDKQTLEGRTVSRDVAEIYIPILNEGKFIGAFELYYDLTARKDELDNLLIKEALIGALISLLIFTIVFSVLIKAWNISYKNDLTEEKIRLINMNLEKLVDKKTHEIRVTQEVSIQSLAILAESYDPDTGLHLKRIQNLTHIIASRLKEKGPYASYLATKENYVNEIALASILHDIGKTSIPVEILSKPAKLTEEEFETVKQHTTVAGNILNLGNETFIKEFGKDSYLALAADIALYHHEKWDGTGYPHGTSGENIPLSARIVALADVYDALRSKRPYKTPWTHERTIELIKAETGKHFDPVVVAAFMDVEHLFKDESIEFCPITPPYLQARFRLIEDQ
ncbi:HD domain-containing protein [Desulfovibrio mangrovi]|uniref:HD-GYP domain-containing protein n=1 Tax=Desulfovibrio mangrovi TaxID=2976983 RepID=UPI002245937A|nr:HD domain-containing phosphohydrolase [Desulfovibrio mangrovi]UZP66629.1 HD domain-containing protein [Desulfovibrio mangrovi]